jgi:hypothetical protein
MSSNPFSTRFVRPGALEYLFADGESADGIVARLRAHGWRGAIFGPHGSGKSSLLAALRGPLSAAGRRLVEFTLRDGQRRLPARLDAAGPLDPATLLVIDGYEQLGWMARRSVRRACHRSGCGLLVTAHRRVGLHVVARTAPSPGLALRIVQALTAGRGDAPTEGDIAAAYAAHCAGGRGDLREMLFDLYDRHQRQRTEC